MVIAVDEYLVKHDFTGSRIYMIPKDNVINYHRFAGSFLNVRKDKINIRSR